MSDSRMIYRWSASLLAIFLLAGCQQSSIEPAKESQPSSVESPQGAGTAAGVNKPQGESAPQESSTPSSNDSSSSTSPSKPTETSTTKAELGEVTAVRMIDADSGWLGGIDWIARTDDGGQKWQVQYKTKGRVQQLFALNGQMAWATVSQGDSNQKKVLQLLYTTDGGTNWSAVGTVPNRGFLHFVNATEGYSGNARTIDGGKTWKYLAVPPKAVGDAYFHDKLNGWAVVSENETRMGIERTTDGGKSWQRVMNRETTAPVLGAVIRSAGAQDAWVECIGDSGMSQTSYSLFHTTDGGKHWQTVIAKSTAGGGPAPGFTEDKGAHSPVQGNRPGPLYVVNAQVAYIGGECPACEHPNSLSWTTDGGKTLTEATTKLDGYGGALLAFADNIHGWWITNMTDERSILYTTTNGAKSWQQVYVFPHKKE